MKPVASFALLLVALAAAAQAPPLEISGEPPPRAFLQHAYSFRLEASGGVPPLTMKVVAGNLPPGLELAPSGRLMGTPTDVGGYEFTVEVSDSAQPVRSARREYRLKVVRPLAVTWKSPPEVRGRGIYGSVEVMNTSETPADVTVIIVAVNQYGKAFVLGYDRAPMAAEAAPHEVEFGATLPTGSYSVRVDAIAEVAPRNEIWRDALATPAPLAVTAPP